MLLGVYFTRLFLRKMKKAKSPRCLGCNVIDEDLSHFFLQCDYYKDIRDKLGLSCAKLGLKIEVVYPIFFIFEA